MIKECVKEVIFEEGILSGIITEVANGLSASRNPASVMTPPSPTPLQESSLTTDDKAKMKVLSAIGNNGYDDLKKQFANPGLFEGTTPIAGGDGRGPFSGINPDDPGINLNNIPGMGSWAAMAAGKRK